MSNSFCFVITRLFYLAFLLGDFWPFHNLEAPAERACFSSLWAGPREAGGAASPAPSCPGHCLPTGLHVDPPACRPPAASLPSQKHSLRGPARGPGNPPGPTRLDGQHGHHPDPRRDAGQSWPAVTDQSRTRDLPGWGLHASPRAPSGSCVS